MHSTTRATYTHRTTQDGLYESICSDCFATVASVQYERELAFQEEAHRCNPIRLYQLTQHCDHSGTDLR
jgi:hypothetical protein